MAQIHWLNRVDGAFTKAADWSGGVAPGASDDAILSATGTAAFTVTATVARTVNSLQTATGATLDIAGVAFTAVNGSGAGVNAGLISATGSGAVFKAGGTIDNTGAINIAGHAGKATFSVGAGGLTLDGGGAVVLEGAGLTKTGSNVITGATSAATLTNHDNTISGGGQLGLGALSLVNAAAGIIDANNSVALVLDTGAGNVANAGLIEATGAGRLNINATQITQSGSGSISAAGGTISLQGAKISGGALTSSGAGLIQIGPGSSVLDGSAAALTNEAITVIDPTCTLTIQGAIDNVARIGMHGAGVQTTLQVGAPGATLTGGGTVLLDRAGGNQVIGASATATLTNVDNLIQGFGDLGGGQMKLVNQAGGTIIANVATHLTIDTGANAITNAGVIRVVGTATIESAVVNTGLLQVEGGTLTVDGAVAGAGTVRISNGVADFTSTFSENVHFGADGTLELARSRSFGGKISNFSRTGNDALDLLDIAFVSGTTKATYAGNSVQGVLTVTDGTHTAKIHFLGNYTHSTFTVSSDGHGGTTVVDPSALTGAMAAFAPAAGSTSGNVSTSSPPPPLVAPHG